MHAAVNRGSEEGLEWRQDAEGMAPAMTRRRRASGALACLVGEEL